MERVVGAFEARRRFGKLLEEVVAKGESYVVERHGEPVAAVVPIAVYQHWKRDRESSSTRSGEHRNEPICRRKRPMLLPAKRCVP